MLESVVHTGFVIINKIAVCYRISRRHINLSCSYGITVLLQCIDNTRDGWFFTNGKGIHVNWEKTSDYGATRYYDDNGNEIELNTGKTMVCIVEDGDSFLVDDQKIGASE